MILRILFNIAATNQEYSLCPDAGILAKLFLVLGVTQVALGDPISVSFTATVHDVFRDVGLTLDLDVENGDKITGRFTYEPVSSPPPENPLAGQKVSFVQPYCASLRIANSVLQTPTLSPEIAWRAVKNAWIFDGPQALEDRIELSSLLVPSSQTSMPTLASADLQAEFWGPQSLLSSAGVPGDIAVLNGFDFLTEVRLHLVDTSALPNNR